MPNANWEYLNTICQKLDIKLINLTEPLITRAKFLLKEKNQLVWWKDDTHWNKEGIAVAAKEVYKNINTNSTEFQAN